MNPWLLFIIILNASCFARADNISTVNLPRSLLITSSESNTQPIINPPPSKKTSPQFPLALKPKVLAQEPYNSQWFTQGLFKDNDNFYISSGLYNKSVVVYQSPHKNLRYFLPPQYFAEGLTVIDDQLFLLTWKEETLFVFDKETLTLINKITYKGEGWGLTHNKNSFIMSNGSNTISFRDKDSFKVQHTLTLQNFDYINELEYVDGIIWANRWYDEKIYAIDSNSGCILASIDLTSLRLASIADDKKNITNGIAYDKQKNALWVTGKYWSQRFLIALPPIDKSSCI